MARTWGGTTGSVDSGLTAHNTLRTYFGWYWRTGDGENSLGRMWDKRNNGATEVELFYNDAGGNTYQFLRTWSTPGQWTIARPSTGAWHPIGINYDSGSIANVPVIYVDGAPVTVGALVPPLGTIVDNASSYWIGNRGDDTRTWDGKIAWWTVWNALLDADEHAALGAGVNPMAFRRDALVKCFPLFGQLSPEPCFVTGGTGAVVSTTYTDGPPVTFAMPRRKYSFSPPTATGDTQEWLTTNRLAFNYHGPIIRNIPYSVGG